MDGRVSPRPVQVTGGNKVPVTVGRLPPLSAKHGPDSHSPRSLTPTSPLLPARRVGNCTGDSKPSEISSSSSSSITTTALHIAHGNKRAASPQGKLHGSPLSPRLSRVKSSDARRSSDDVKFREELCSPAPWRDDDDNDDDKVNDGCEGRGEEEVMSKNSGRSFPAIKVERCEEGGPSRKNLLPDILPFGQDRRSLSSNCLGVPSPLQQRRAPSGRLVVMTESLRGMKTMSKSEGCLQEAIKVADGRSPRKPLDLDFRPAQMARPNIRSTAEVSAEEILGLQGRRSTSPRSLSPVSPLLSPGSPPGHSPFSSPRKARIPPISPKQNTPVIVPTTEDCK